MAEPAIGPGLEQEGMTDGVARGHDFAPVPPASPLGNGPGDGRAVVPPAPTRDPDRAGTGHGSLGTAFASLTSSAHRAPTASISPASAGATRPAIRTS